MSNMIFKKMSEVMKEIGPVSKSQTNNQQGFKFRGIDQFVNSLHPALVKYGVFMTPRATNYTQELKEVVRSSGKAGIDKHVTLMMEYDFYAEDGSKVTVGPIPAEGLDSGDKATNKALSAALKYALIQTFSVPTEDLEEADKESPVMSKLADKSKTSIVSPPFGTSGDSITLGSPPALVTLPSGTSPVVTEPEATKPRSSFRKSTPAVKETPKAGWSL